MDSNTVNAASAYFNAHWQGYQNTIRYNTIYHREMLSALIEFLSSHKPRPSITFVDVGCGDSSTIAPILAHYPIKRYIGIDQAKDVLKMAEKNMATIPCETKFIADNMLSAIPSLDEPVDIIYTSYAVHHLHLNEKKQFLARCQEKLKSGGFLLMIDGILKENQSRDAWLDQLQARYKETIPEISDEEVASKMSHPRADDFPEPVVRFSSIAQEQGWADFKLLAQEEIVAFMAFEK